MRAGRDDAPIAIASRGSRSTARRPRGHGAQARGVFFPPRRAARGGFADGTRDPRRGGRPPDGLDRGTVSNIPPSRTIATVEWIVRGVVAARLRSVRRPRKPFAQWPSASALDNWLERQRLVFCLFNFLKTRGAERRRAESRADLVPPVVSVSSSGCRRRRGHRGHRRGDVRPRGPGGHGGRAGG